MNKKKKKKKCRAGSQVQDTPVDLATWELKKDYLKSGVQGQPE
jgi:hypothetical protein